MPWANQNERKDIFPDMQDFLLSYSRNCFNNLCQEKLIPENCGQYFTQLNLRSWINQ
jgi:hypothetical protein